MPGHDFNHLARLTFTRACIVLGGLVAAGLAKAGGLAAVAAAPSRGLGGWIIAALGVSLLFGLAAYLRKRFAPAQVPKQSQRAQVPKQSQRAQVKKPAVAFRTAPPPMLETIEWDRPIAKSPPDSAENREPAVTAEAVAAAPRLLPDERHQRVLDRYIGARFPGVADCTEDLMDSGRVIKAARLLFDDGRAGRAVELLSLAGDANPRDESTALAQLELLFLERDTTAFVGAVRRFDSRHPDSTHWPEIRELGRALGLGGDLFADRGDRETSHPQYGPWPGMPNWIQAPWDLTGEVTLADLHYRMRPQEGPDRFETQRKAA